MKKGNLISTWKKSIVSLVERRVFCYIIVGNNAKKKNEKEESLVGLSNDFDDVELMSQEKKTDPNETLYCVCNKPSYGDMVQCDNNTVYAQ
jgi:hypothetical protein